MKLIEVKQAKECASTLFKDPILTMAVNAVMDNCPGFELVRCKDCVYAKKDGIHQISLLCTRFMTGKFAHRMRPYDFCSYGERRTDGSKA